MLKYIYVLLISMVPIIELRGAIPYSQAMFTFLQRSVSTGEKIKDLLENFVKKSY